MRQQSWILFLNKVSILFLIVINPSIREYIDVSCAWFTWKRSSLRVTPIEKGFFGLVKASS